MAGREDGDNGGVMESTVAQVGDRGIDNVQGVSR